MTMHELISGKDWRQMLHFQGDNVWPWYFDYQIYV